MDREQGVAKSAVLRGTTIKPGKQAVQLSLAALLAGFGGVALATDIEPRAYSNIPVGMNFLVVGYAYTGGSVSFAPSVPIKNGELQIHTALAAYARSLDIWGHSGKFDIILPSAALAGKADVLGEERQRDVAGLADPMLRVYVNLYGAPALSVKDFGAYRQDLIIGTSLTLVAPGGQYDPNKLVNIGTNRWAFKPEIGVSKAWGSLTAELAAGAYLFSDNTSPYQSGNMSQDPLFALQGHLIYNFGKGLWAAFDLNYYVGGETVVDDRPSDNSLESLRLGGTLAFPLSRYSSLKLYGNTSAHTRIGGEFDTVGIAWQYRWGDGF